jgi:1-acylglycerone phosphate reductase
MAMVQAFFPLLAAAKGLVINISSLSSLTPYCFGSVYCATKGALSSYSRTLRMELRPFGVRVMVAVTGTVKSNIAKLHRSLPEDSAYKPVEDVYQWRLTYSQTHAGVTAAQYAEQLVAAALRQPGWFSSGPPDWFWAGGFAWGVWFLTSLGEWAVDAVLARTFRVPEMTARIQAAQAKRID